jgi:hypothetical protein
MFSLSSYVEDNQTTTSTSYVDLTTVGPLVTIPKAGDYEVRWGMSYYYTAGGPGNCNGFAAVKLGTAETVDANSFNLLKTSATGLEAIVTGTKIKTFFLDAGEVIKLQYRVNGIATGHFLMRWMVVTPVTLF